MSSEVWVFIALLIVALITIDTYVHKKNIIEKLYIGMPVDTMIDGILTHGYITAFNNKTVSIVLFDYPHELIERKITELIF